MWIFILIKTFQIANYYYFADTSDTLQTSPSASTTISLSIISVYDPHIAHGKKMLVVRYIDDIRNNWKVQRNKDQCGL